ncbi:hypothetical protein KAR91_82925 [Candidatus Pacearchaeota archaeon]|nr:hypothetical protein [Candidatus Pacearchaeota archaeon]
MKLSDILKEAKAPQAQIDAALKMETGLDTANSEAKTRRLKIKELEEGAAKFKDVDPTKYKEAMDTLAKLEEDKATKAGDFEKVKQTLVENHNKATKELTEGRDGWKKKYETLAVDKEIITAAAAGKAIKATDIAALVRSNITMGDDGTIAIKKDGKPLMDSEGKNVSVKKYVTDYLGENLNYVQGSGGGGGSLGGSGEGQEGEVRGQSRISKGLKDRQNK